MVGDGILHYKGEEAMELVGAVADKGDIISLTNGSHMFP